MPTGIEHGTVTVVAGGKPYEVTTLRADVETDGRRAKVVVRPRLEGATPSGATSPSMRSTPRPTARSSISSAGWPTSKAARCASSATPEQRIREDYLRILRFFRFFAWYGSGRPDAEGLKACARLKDGLDQLSAERVWAELKKLLSAPDPSRALLWMRQAGVLTKVLPESEKWGIDAIHGLVSGRTRSGLDGGSAAAAGGDRAAGRGAHGGDGRAAAGFRRRESERLSDWALRRCSEARRQPTGELRKALYGGDRQGIGDRLRLALAAARVSAIDDNDALG